MSGSVEMNPLHGGNRKRPQDSITLFGGDEGGGRRGNITQDILDSMNVEQARSSNKDALNSIGGVIGLSSKLGVDLSRGLTQQQVLEMRSKFGDNVFPESPMKTFMELFFESFEDMIIQILIGAAIVSLVVGMIEHHETGWIEGAAILIAVLIVAVVTATNNYTKELQFRALEKSSQVDDRCSVMREGVISRINPSEIVVGDVIVLQAGDAIPADCVICDNSVVRANESALTGEAEDLKKCPDEVLYLLYID